MSTSDIDVRTMDAPISLYASLANSAFVVDSGELVEHDNLSTLIKVPFVITHVAYRKGDIVQKGETEPGSYVSVTATIADEATLLKLAKFGRIDFDAIPFMPEESIVFNDGSTGVKRQITEFLHGQQYITVAEGSELVIGGASGASSFDLPPHRWANVSERGTFQLDDDGFGLYEVKLDIPIHCRRGLRPSQYSNEYAKDATTYYLA